FCKVFVFHTLHMFNFAYFMLSSMQKILYSIILLLSCLGIQAQEYFTLSGYVRSANTGEELIGASVIQRELNIGTTANVYGFYSTKLPRRKHEITYSFIGYEDVRKSLDFNQDLQMNVKLFESTNELEEVEISAERSDENVKRIEMSAHTIDAQVIKKIPALLGEADVIKSVLMLPGVSTVGEGSTGFNVRGGGIDQNLVLMDEAP